MAIIFKGWHYSLPMFPWLVKTNKLKKVVEFTNSCRYDLQTTDQQDWNKLTGFTLGASLKDNIHKDSVRIVWRYNVKEEVIELTWYCYVSGQRVYNDLPLYKAKIGEKVTVLLTLAGNYYLTFMGEKYASASLPGGLKNAKWGWRCFPYFGGNRKAPHTMKIHLK